LAGGGKLFLNILQQTLYMKGFSKRLPFVILICKQNDSAVQGD
jgi:hypothetical protein